MQWQHIHNRVSSGESQTFYDGVRIGHDVCVSDHDGPWNARGSRRKHQSGKLLIPDRSGFEGFADFLRQKGWEIGACFAASHAWRVRSDYHRKLGKQLWVPLGHGVLQKRESRLCHLERIAKFQLGTSDRHGNANQSRTEYAEVSGNPEERIIRCK